MKNKSFLFMLFIAVFAMSFTACDDDKDEVTPVYSYGITFANFTTVTTSADPSSTTGTNEQSVILNAFAEAFKESLGVSETLFPYNGGDDKVIEACKKAAAVLDAKSFKGKYTVEVTKVQNGFSTIYTWKSPEPTNPAPGPGPEPEPQKPELADYSIIIYGHGGGNLDDGILSNIAQLYDAYESSYNKVKAVVQYKFSSVTNLTEGEGKKCVDYLVNLYDFNGTEWAQTHGGKTIRYVFDPTKKFEDVMFHNPSPEFLDDNNLDVGNPQNLTEYIKWAVAQAPAKKYVLILSDHGGGYVPLDDVPSKSLSKSVIFDDGNNSSNLTVFEVAEAISQSGIKPEVLYFDACLMNSLEYLFELKDVANYIVASTFIVPGQGGYYTALVNELANRDIETALTNLCKESMKIWDADRNNYSDISVFRTSALDAFGSVWKDFTDRLIKAYTEGGQEVKSKIDEATSEEVFKVDNAIPAYASLMYAAAIAEAAPEYFPQSFCVQMEQAYEACVVSNQSSMPLRMIEVDIAASVMLGCQGHFRRYQWLNPQDAAQTFPDLVASLEQGENEAEGEEEEDDEEAGNGWILDNGWVLWYYEQYNADGTVNCASIDGKTADFNWNATLDGTYKRLKFDQLTGWSRWIELNEAEPLHASPATMDMDLSDEDEDDPSGPGAK